jgi:hypothetical protein
LPNFYYCNVKINITNVDLVDTRNFKLQQLQHQALKQYQMIIHALYAEMVRQAYKKCIESGMAKENCKMGRRRKRP